MIDSMMRRPALALILLAFAVPVLPAGPALTTVQDTIYKADGTPFTGLLYIDWQSFTTGDARNVATHNLVATVVNGVLRVQLAPTTNASPAAWYQVRYNSNGYVQFTEYWNVPPGATPVGLSAVRMAAPPGSIGAPAPPPPSTSVQISDVAGLSDELSARVVRGPAFQPSRTAVINGSGMLEGASGNTYDCVRVDGSSGSCGGGEAAPTFVDAETPSGNTDGSNTVFTLANPPSPASSLSLYRNGVLQKPGADFTLSGNIITFAGGAAPASGDLLLASYRTPPQGSAGGALSGALTGNLPNPSLAPAIVTDYNIAPGAGIPESKLSLNFPTHSNANDPTSDQKQAMGGTTGIVSGSNRFVTDQDPRLLDARAPKGHAILGAAHSDTVAGTAIRGDIIVAQGQGVWTRLPLGPPNRCLMSNGADAVWNTCLFTGFSSGSIPFIDPSGSLSQNSARLFWDNSSRRFGIGTNTPTSTLHVQDAATSTGSTTLTVRAGQGQNLNPLERWLDVNGVELGRVGAQGDIAAAGFQAASTIARAAWRDSGASSDPGLPADGDTWYNTTALAHKSQDGGQTHPQPQVICGSTGTSTGNASPASLGTCTLPPGLVQPGDRIELKFDSFHAGNTSGFTLQIDVNQAPLFSAWRPPAESFLSGSVGAGFYSTGMQWTAQLQDSTSALAPQIGVLGFTAPAGLTIDLRGSLDQSGADTVMLQNFTVLRYPAQANP